MGAGRWRHSNRQIQLDRRGANALVYLAQKQDPGTRSTLVVAAGSDPAALASSLRGIVREIDPNMPISSVRTMEEFYYGNATGIVHTLTAIAGAMGLLGLLLSLVGLYGLVAYAAARRTREIGIRMAVGARSSSVLRMVLRHGLALSVSGVVLGVIGSIAVGRVLRGVFPATGTIDVATTFSSCRCSWSSRCLPRSSRLDARRGPIRLWL